MKIGDKLPEVLGLEVAALGRRAARYEREFEESITVRPEVS